MGFGSIALVKRRRQGLFGGGIGGTISHNLWQPPLTESYHANIVDNSAGYLRRGQGRR
jgi:hypothetical protein